MACRGVSVWGNLHVSFLGHSLLTHIAVQIPDPGHSIIEITRINHGLSKVTAWPYRYCILRHAGIAQIGCTQWLTSLLRVMKRIIMVLGVILSFTLNCCACICKRILMNLHIVSATKQGITWNGETLIRTDIVPNYMYKWSCDVINTFLLSLLHLIMWVRNAIWYQYLERLQIVQIFSLCCSIANAVFILIGITLISKSPVLLFLNVYWVHIALQWNLSTTTTFIITYITCDLFSSVF